MNTLKMHSNMNTLQNTLRVRDHCHYTVKYRVPAHSIHNLQYSMPKEILVVFRSASNCD